MALGTGGSQDLGIPGILDAVLIGSGGSSRVYRATQAQLSRTVAVKVLIGTDPKERKQFDRESKALGRLASHPGIVSVYDAGFTDAGDPYLLLEYCGGGSLSDRLNHAVLPWPEAVAFLAPVAETLAHAHAQGLVHRDLKPGNILLDDHGRPMIADFGLARLIDAEASSGQASLAAFTPGYVPPETLSGEPATTASDVYSLGGTLYSLLSGLVPFVDTDSTMNIVALAKRIAEQPVPDLRPLGVPEPVCALVEQCMAKEPAARPSAHEMAARLQTMLAQPVSGSATTELAPDANSTVHLTPDDLARPIETVAPSSTGPQTIAPGSGATSEPQNQVAAPVFDESQRSRSTETTQRRRTQKRAPRTRALLLGILLGLVALAIIALGFVAYLRVTGEDLPTITFPGNTDDESSLLTEIDDEVETAATR